MSRRRVLRLHRIVVHDVQWRWRSCRTLTRISIPTAVMAYRCTCLPTCSFRILSMTNNTTLALTEAIRIGQAPRTDVRACVAYSNNSCLLEADVIELPEVRIREFRLLAPLNLTEVCGQN